MEYNIYNKNGTLKAKTASIEYRGEWMGSRNVTVSVKSSAPVAFSVGDYLIYRGERFELNVSPSVEKQAKTNSYGEAYTYNNIKFDSLTDELVRCFFFDCTVNNGVVTAGTSSKFQFYCSTVADLASRIQANLDRLYTGAKQWTVQVVEGYTPTTDKEMNTNLSADNINCWQALAMAYEQMGVKFVVEKQSRTITLGTSGTIHDTLLFGKGYGLKKITKTSEQNQNIVTKVRAYGNTTNMPQHYYYYKVLHCVCPMYYDSTNDWYKIATPNGVTSTEMLFMIRNENPIIDAYEDITWYSHNVIIKNGDTILPISFARLSYRETDNSVWVYPISGSYLMPDNLSEVTIEIVSVNKHYIPMAFRQSDVNDNAALLPVKNLMLSGYPTQTLDPYVLSDNAATLGIREAVVYFDGSNDNEDIFPTLSGVTMKNIEDAGYVAYIATEDTNKTKDNIRLDEILDDSRKPLYPISRAEDYNNNSLIDDDGVFDEESSFTDADGHFLVRIRNIGFDLASARVKLSSTEYPVLSMKDGMCGGREFNIVDCKLSSNQTYYTLQCERVKDDSLNQYFPNRTALIRANDRFIITNINMPDMYIDAASVKLRQAALLWLTENETTTFQYSVELDNIYLARQHDYAIANNETSIHDTIKEGDVLCFSDADLGITEAIEISNLTIKEGDKPIPEYSVTLRSEKSVSSLQKIQNAIRGITDGSISVPGISVPQIKDIVSTTIKNLKLDDKYLNKTTDDEATGAYTFHGGITFGDQSDNTKKYVQGVKGGKIYWNGSGWCVDTDYLNVHKKAIFKELEIDEVSHIGGQQILTACGCVVEHVYLNRYGSSYYIFFAKEDKDGKPVTNDWKVGDLAYCQTFNVKEGVSQDVSNRYYWAKVLYITDYTMDAELTDSITGETFNPSKYHRIVIKCTNTQGQEPNCDIPSLNADGTPCVDTNKNVSDTPTIGDNIVLMGHVKQPEETEQEARERQGATLLAGAGQWQQALVMWTGIGADANNPFVMPEPQVVISPSGVKIVADEIALKSSGQLLLTSNQLKCTNLEGRTTLGLDAYGNAFFSGPVNQMSLSAIGENYNIFFEVLNKTDRENVDSTQLPYSGTGKLLTYFTDLNYDDMGMLFNLGDHKEAESGISFLPDMMRLNGVVHLGDIEGAEGLYDEDSEDAEDFDASDKDVDIILPFCIPIFFEKDRDGNYNVISNQTWTHFDICRTPTHSDEQHHLITWNEMNAIVGRKITFHNNSASNVFYIKFPNMQETNANGDIYYSFANPSFRYGGAQLSPGRFVTVEYVAKPVLCPDSYDATITRQVLGIFPIVNTDNYYDSPEGYTNQWGNDEITI